MVVRSNCDNRAEELSCDTIDFGQRYSGKWVYTARVRRSNDCTLRLARLAGTWK